MRSIRSHLLALAALLALGLAVSAPCAAAAAIPSGTTAPGGAASSGATGGNVTGQSQQLSKLTGEATPEEQEEELAEKNAAAVKSTESKPVSTGLIALIGVVAAVLLGGIVFLIFRDLRSVAPATGLAGSGSARDRAMRQRKRKAKAKAARRARKHNR